jgi:hypothetical protein
MGGIGTIRGAGMMGIRMPAWPQHGPADTTQISVASMKQDRMTDLPAAKASGPTSIAEMTLIRFF